MKQFYLVLIISTLSLFINLSLCAQNKVKEITLKNVQGTAIGNNNESIDQVTQRAVNEAKIAALKQAGIEENISSFTDYFQSENNNNYEELFASDILSDIRGTIKAVEILEANKTFNEFGNLNIEVTINCTVVKYISNKDFSFDVWVDGVGMFYQNETKLIFKVKPSKDTYVNMFIFNETEAYQLFPNELESPLLLEKNTPYVFPSYKADYILETNKKSEAHRMIMVFTKEMIPYTADIEYKKIIDWIFSIPPDMRVVKSFGFNVVKEDKLIK
jgi:hypothetical protein